jgi:hypothetical protein
MPNSDVKVIDEAVDAGDWPNDDPELGHVSQAA